MESMSDLSLTLIVAASPLVVAVWIACWTAFTHVRWALYYRRQDFKPRPLGGRGWVRFYLRTIGSAYIIVWWGLRAMFRDRLRYPAGARSGRPVLCVHGFHMNSTCMWGIRRHLESQGRPTRSVFLGAPYQKAEIYAGPLSRAMHELALQFPEEGFDVVAHSMGGLIVRLALARDPELAGKMHRIVTLGTPHHGTSLLRWFRFGPVFQMMSRDSRFIRELPDLDTSAPTAAVTTVATEHDLVVYPLSTCHLPGSRAVNLSGIGHLGLLMTPVTLETITSALEL
jgi:pimeloyl-ACP methyl ester carboxylesterase